MKKIFFAAVAAAAVLTLPSCSGSKENKNEDSAAVDSAAIIDEAVAAVVDATKNEADSAKNSVDAKYDAAFFRSEENKADKASDSKYAQTASGLKYVVVKEGTGKSPVATDRVKVNYSGRLLDGTQFDSSYDRGEPIVFPLNGVIKGWTEGLQLMKEGGTTIFYIPSDIAYGPTGTPGGPIPPNAPLIFTVDLIEVNPQ